MQLEDAYPLSPVQHAMLVRSLAAARSGVYVQQLVGRLQEALDVSVFKEAWQRITARYPIFRTSFNWKDGQSPSQQVHLDVQLQFSEQDLCDTPELQQEEVFANFLAADRQRGFELDQAPLSRHALLRFAKADYRWVWTSHHAVMDGRSRLLVLKELFELYDNLCAGRTSQLSHPPPFRHYIDWLSKQDCSASKEFWTCALAGFESSTALGVDHAPAVKIADGLTAHDEQTFRFPEDFTRSLCDVARERGLTPNTFLQGAWAILLSRFSGEEDVVFGSTRAGRHPDIESPASMVGLLIHTVPVRVRVTPSQLLLDWLQDLRSQWITLRNHEHTPLAEIQKCSQVPLNKPLFESLLSVENYELNTALQGQLRWKVAAQFRLIGRTSYPLAVTATLGPVLQLNIAYDVRRFERETISRMLGHLKTLLEGIVANPEQKISELPLLTESERHQLLVQWNDTRRDFPSDKCIHQLFEAQVERTPDAVALVFEDQQLSYGELNSRANQLAHSLKSLGLVPEEIVGICVERSLEMIVGLLAILKAGGAYLPLDPSYPKERLSFMLQDSGAPVLITQQAFVDAFDYTGKMICLDKDWEKVGQVSANNLVADTSSDSLAYVIYTSGSTGQPKGVAVSHRAVNRLVMNTDYVQVTPAEVMAQGSNVSFDAATFEIWGALLNGAQLVLIAKDTLISAKSLSTVIERHGITTLFLTTALFNQMVDQAPTVLGRLRHLLFGGEGVDPQRVHELLQSGGPSRLLHVYGPTETTTFATWYWVKAVAADAITVPIGRPIANTEIYILDDHMNPVPIGVRGELYIGGPGVARGYLNRPELTREKFIANPFSADATNRLYKTGDLARYLPDGNIEFLGRIDDQVKIRGYRIELGEIEAVLGQYPAIRESVVLAREDTPGDRRLVAYVVPVPGLAPPASEMRSFLQQKLPEYMVPSAFVFLDSLPLTSNGKLDRRALPAPDQRRPEPNETFTPPRTPIEEILASIWAELLSIDKVGIHDNFFDLGGHSLLALQLVFKISTVLERDVSVKMLFMHPTITELAGALYDDCKPQEPVQENQRKTVTVAQARKDKAVALEEVVYVEFERRPLLSLIATGKIAPVDAAALVYLSEETLSRAGLTREAALIDWYDNLPTVDGIYETGLGRVALIMLPRLRSELYNDQDELVSSIVDALEISRQIGARAVSLTGLLPSATDYGHAVANLIAKRSDLPVVTTGHATTVSVAVMTIEKILRDAGRDLTHESVALLGLGSIGYTTLRLALRRLPHPRKILICDVFSKKTWLDQVCREIVDDLGFKGCVEVAASSHQLPPEVYQASLIIGATNVADILNISAVKPGTVIVDDSGPHCFATAEAIKRFELKRDILFTEGGVVRMPSPWRHVKYLPRRLEQRMQPSFIQAMLTRDPSQIGGCVLSSLLSAGKERLVPTLGMPDDVSCLDHHRGLERLECSAARLHCEGYVLPAGLVEEFRRRFGSQ